MLDTETKRRVDTARDILVGKVPNPQSQVEQITIALIYKFMDDMDSESEDLGGEPSFFIGEYEKFGWRNIFSPGIGGFEMLNLYSEAIQKMAQNPHLPQLFRDIFKNAYLPYRDPETLKSFLKIINDFSYDHSEKLGDAFEYLLSVLGSQGDAGQFRTPRHIIEFMTALINPLKTETILDPACGTAGFLISAYKHILKNNSSNYKTTDPYIFEQNNVKLAEITLNGKHYRGDKLTPEERSKIISNIKGYDISPDMVRLSLVNLYLHGFTDPHIYEYDTLTSEERWNEYNDIILANPPFMSPKGGIRPHKRFSIESKRSEVLFVDYMMEHLTPIGRAAIIVPEGIIFQSGTAYKSLRKKLIEENYLVGVISLPYGVFNPYSGVKTSILWLDKVLAKKTDKIIFAKIENDGFDLGAQRRPIKQNDFPSVFKELTKYRDALLHDNKLNIEDDVLVSVVNKKKIAEKKEYNLNGDIYKTQIQFESDFPIVVLKDVAEIISGQSPSSDNYNEKGEGSPFYQGKTAFSELYIEAPTKWTTQITKEADKGDILMSVRAPVGPVNLATQKICIGRGLASIRVKKCIDNKFLFYLLKGQEQNIKGNGGAVFDSISRDQIENIQIPIPPLPIQEKIVAEIESYQKIIDGARQVVENYKPIIDIDPDWEMVELGEVANLIGGGTPSKSINEYWEDGDIDWVTCSDFVTNSKILPDSIRKITKKGLDNSSSNLISEGSLLLVTRVSLGKMAFTSKPTAINQDLTAILFDSLKINKYFGYYYLLSISSKIQNDGNGVTVKGVTRSYVKEIKIPLPALEIQNQIVVKLEQEQNLIDASKNLIEVFEQKIKERIDKVWGE